MLAAAKAIEEDYLSLQSRQYFADSSEGRRARDGLRQRLYEFVDSGTNLGKAFRHLNPRIPLESIDGMRFYLAHNYPEVSAEVVWAFAQRHILPTARRLRRCKFPSK